MQVEDAEDYGALNCGGRVLPRYDNTLCIEWGNNVIGGRERAKHIDIRKHFAHEVIQNGQMRLVKVPTSAQMNDIMTKVFHRKTKPATRQGRRASLSIHGPDREVYRSLRWTELRQVGPDDASTRQHSNGTRRLTLGRSRVDVGADRGYVPK